jgi:hypothetical protein
VTKAKDWRGERERERERENKVKPTAATHMPNTVARKDGRWIVSLLEHEPAL